MAILPNGYNLIWVNGRHVYEHRYLMERHLGRKLKRTEQVHHKNGIRSDNRLANLEFCTNQLDHARKSESFGRPKQKPCFCGRPNHAKGLCRRHYMRAFRPSQAKDPHNPRIMKRDYLGRFIKTNALRINGN